MNTLVTALIVYRIISVYNDIRGFNHTTNAIAHGGQRDLYPLISILIESGLITFVGQLAQSIMYKFAEDAFPLVGGCVVMLYVRVFLECRSGVFNFICLLRSQGISTTVVLVRVESGVSYDHNTSRTLNSRISGSNFNQPGTTKVGSSE